MRFRSSRYGKAFSHSRTGSPPARVLKKNTGIRLPSAAKATRRVYHARYTRVG